MLALLLFPDANGCYVLLGDETVFQHILHYIREKSFSSFNEEKFFSKILDEEIEVLCTQFDYMGIKVPVALSNRQKIIEVISEALMINNIFITYLYY